MRKNHMTHDWDYLNKLDSWLERYEGGSIASDVLRARGFEIVPGSDVDDAQLHATLWQLIEKLAEIGVYLWGTDHLSDRALYDEILEKVLPVESFLLPDDPWSGTHFDLSGELADDPEPGPFARDRSLPSIEKRVAAMPMRETDLH